MKSIWSRPLKRKSWLFISITIVAGLALIVFYPLLSATIQWYGHPTVDYGGLTLRLPFGWIYSPNELPLTTRKPWPSVLTGVESSLLIQKNGVADVNREALVIEWARLHPSSNLWTNIEVSPLTPHEGLGLSLRCSRQEAGRKWGAARLECLSVNAEWSFRFLGQQSDMEQAESIMQNVLARAAVSR